MTQDKAYERLRSARQRIADQSEVTGHMITAVKEGRALADDGNTYDSVQDAVDAASSFVKVGPGTFNESVNISTVGISLIGSGESTLIDAVSKGDAISTTDDVTVSNIAVRTDSSSSGRGVTSGNNNVLKNITCLNSGDIGIAPNTDSVAYNCTALNSSASGIRSLGNRVIISNCDIDNTGSRALYTTNNDNILANNVILNSGGHGIRLQNANDCVVIGNRVHNSTDAGFFVSSTSADNILANCRISDSGSTDINNNGSTNLVTDGNLTGASN